MVGSREIRLDAFDEVRVGAIGKASDALVRALAGALDVCGIDPRARRAVVVAHAPASHEQPSWVTRLVGGHPTPDAASFAAGRSLLDLFSGCTERTLAIFLLSGGGSALAECPLDDALGPARLAEINDALVRADLPIRAINAVRKRLSAIKGGRLGLAAAPATELTLVVSDVAPGDVQSVASGPTVPDETTIDEAEAALERLGPPVRPALVDTPSREALARIASTVEVLLDCETAARAAERAASDHAERVASLGCLDGPLDEVVDRHLAELERLLVESDGARCAVVSSGEVTLDVTGEGLGGRNQQTVLRALVRARDLCPSAREIAILSAGTDGRDGPTDAAGAVAGFDALDAARVAALDPNDHLARCDAYRFFDPLGALVRTGPTGTNVRDVRVLLGRGARS